MRRRVARVAKLIGAKRPAFVCQSHGHLFNQFKVGPRHLSRTCAFRLIDQNCLTSELVGQD